jgi:hypothetical protein
MNALRALGLAWIVLGAAPTGASAQTTAPSPVAGMNACLTKPIDWTRLFAALVRSGGASETEHAVHNSRFLHRSLDRAISMA